MAWIPQVWGTGPPPIGGHSASLLGSSLIIFGGNADVRSRQRDNSIVDEKAIAIDAKNTLQNATYTLDLGSVSCSFISWLTSGRDNEVDRS